MRKRTRNLDPAGEREARSTFVGRHRAKVLALYRRLGAKEAAARSSWSTSTIERWARDRGIVPLRSRRRSAQRQTAKARLRALEKARARPRLRSQNLEPGLIDRETLLERGVPEWIVDRR